MGQQVVLSAMCQCSFGEAPSSLVVEPIHRTLACEKPAANIMDHIPMANIMPFAMCTTVSNPEVAAATAAALGVLTPMPCVPVTAAPWMPGALTVLLDGKPALDNNSKAMCTWGGVISINFAGQVTVEIP